ncbi:hypothetical protein I5677_11430 [Mobilitalea sibirica]|uniref:Uncharacterized protein n=1 Tax=Mobilitalea sibirica TaxID=1462919 RepID=A0A8J7H3J0_9FIRM|nr:hypothetical protein [Mobilitalea sibirica]MBH1941505.1 hypothetical protein [Mobilitalea sibirica]
MVPPLFMTMHRLGKMLLGQLNASVTGHPGNSYTPQGFRYAVQELP